jgi:hypothetical protein
MNREAFQEMEEFFLQFDQENIILLGDFNARTATMEDYLETAEDGTISMSESMLSLGIQRERYSMDKLTNNFGHSLIELCISQNLLIVNGRVGDDAGVGKLTCKNASCVDYVLCSPEIFEYISHFSIGAFDDCISDVHCPIFMNVDYDSCSTNANLEPQDNLKKNLKNNETKNFMKPTWKAQYASDFAQNINEQSIADVKSILRQLLENDSNVNDDDINSMTSYVTDIMISAAKDTNMLANETNNNEYSSNKKKGYKKKFPWFDNQCKQKRLAYRKAKRDCSQFGGDHFKNRKKACGKEYKLAVRNKYKAYKRQFYSKVRNLKSNDPKAFWKLVNSLSESDKQQEGPPPNDFVKHFEKLSNVLEDEISSFDEERISSHTLDNSELNSPITMEELEKCLLKLKNNKACGHDQILNEFLKVASTKISDLILLLFNLILKSGKTPNNWSVGFICPVYKGKGDMLNTDNYRGITMLSCFGKLFTSILNDRIHSFLDKNDLLGTEQAGFRKGSSTLDHIFSLHCLIDIYLQRRKRLFCTFVDYKKAFDNVQRNILWEKLLSSGIEGCLLNVIRDLYAKAKSCVKTRQGLSASFFACNIGVRQGENLSPVLFFSLLK